LKFYIAGIGILNLFCSCDLDLDPMTFIYEFDPYHMKIYQTTKNELPISRLSKVILQRDRQTYDTEVICHNALPVVIVIIILIILIMLIIK